MHGVDKQLYLGSNKIEVLFSRLTRSIKQEIK